MRPFWIYFWIYISACFLAVANKQKGSCDLFSVCNMVGYLVTLRKDKVVFIMIVIFVIGEIITSALWCDGDCQAVARLRLRFHPFWWQQPFVLGLHLSNKHLPVREIAVFQVFSSYFLHLLLFWVQVEFAMTLLTDWDSFGDSKWLGTHPWASRFGSFCFTLSLSCNFCCQEGDNL